MQAGKKAPVSAPPGGVAPKILGFSVPRGLCAKALWKLVTRAQPSRRARPAANAPGPRAKEPQLALPAFAEAKRRAAEDVEREYLAWLMTQSDGKVTVAVRLAGMDRSNFRKTPPTGQSTRAGEEEARAEVHGSDPQDPQ